MVTKWRASCLNRGPPSTLGMKILHTSFDTLQHGLNQLKALTMEKVPYERSIFGNHRIDTP